MYDKSLNSIKPDLLEKISAFKKKSSTEEEMRSRVPDSPFTYMGRDTLEEAIAIILAGKNLLLIGEKSTGKNVLAENLAEIFSRPLFNSSMHIDTDASSLIGVDSFKDNRVYFRPGPIYQAAKHGGFCVLDEINMAKNEAIAVLHSALDYRRIIDIPGYEKIDLDPSCRFIATMNPGYAGTRPLNQALLSRFSIIKMPTISKENLLSLIKIRHPKIKESFAEQISLLFYDIKAKKDASQLPEDALDLRGIMDSLDLIEMGLKPRRALEISISNKMRDQYEEKLLDLTIEARISKKLVKEDVFYG